MKLTFRNRPVKDVIVAAFFLMVCVFLVFAAIWAYRTFMTTPPYVNPERYPVKGIDVSAHNGDVDMARVRKSGIEFVFIKASEGVDFRDRKFRQNYENARKAGLKTGVYHFFRFDKDGVEQALNLMRTLGGRRPELGLVIDVEKAGNPDSIPPKDITMRLVQMVDYLNLLGHRVMFYTNRDGYYDYIVDSFPGSPLWICAFSENPINAQWSFWQYNHRGRVDGIKGDVDLNVFCGSRDEWARYLDGDIWPYSPHD